MSTTAPLSATPGGAAASTPSSTSRSTRAVDQVAQETSWSNLLQSLAYQQKAQELATAVAERVYRSDAMKTALEQLAADVGKDIGQQIEFASADASEPTLACLKAFVGARYGTTVARAVSGETGKDLTVDPGQGHRRHLAGRGVARIERRHRRRRRPPHAPPARQHGRRVGQRVVGSVLARLVSVVAGGVGLALIAKDIWDLRHGVLPIIANEMKSKDNKDKVQDELAKTFAEQISGHVEEIGAATADQVVGIWRDFRSAHAQALDLAQRNPKFKAFVDQLQPKALPRLDEVVSLVLARGRRGRPAAAARRRHAERGGQRAAGAGHGDRAADALHRCGPQVGGARRRPAAQGGRARPAPAHDARHADAERAPGACSRFNDRLAIVRLASIERGARDTLFELNDADLKSLAHNLTRGRSWRRCRAI